MKRWIEATDRRPWATAVALIVPSVALAVWNRFIQDDAFISFRYSANLVAGQGLVWNAGEFVEGYTNFLWVLIMSIPIALGFDPVFSSQAIGIGLFAGTLAIVYALSLQVLESTRLAAVVVLLLGTNYTFSAYATGGLETALQTFLVSAGLFCTWRIVCAETVSAFWLLLLSAAVSLAMWTRLDSSVLFLVPYTLALWKILREASDARRKFSLLLCLIAPAVLMIGGWLGWKLWYYGDVLPNTWYAKAGLPISYQRGQGYIVKFLNAYGLTPFMLVIPFAFRARNRHRRTHAALAAILLLWLVYLYRIGGGFMEFRFFVPVMPILFMLLVGVVSSFGRPLGIAVLLVVSMAFSLDHARTFHYDEGIESIALLERHLTHPEEDWYGVGGALARLFPEPSDVAIAVTAAGYLPYRSNLKSVDMLGLVDPWIARNGLFLGGRPGHQRIAPLDYLLGRGVHLVVGHPLMIPLDGRKAYTAVDLDQMYIPVGRATVLPVGARMIEIPVNDQYKVAILLLLPHAEIDRAIAQAGLRTVRLQGIRRDR